VRTDRAQRAQDDDGFTLIELLVAMTVFAVLAAAFALTIGGSLRTYGRARARTLAEQLATERLESARSMEYDDIGNPSSDTPGTIPLEETYTRGGMDFTVRTDVDYVDDAIPTGIRTAANYKRVLVDVTQAGATSPLVSLETLVTPTHMPAADRAAVIVEVFDYASPTPRLHRFERGGDLRPAPAEPVTCYPVRRHGGEAGLPRLRAGPCARQPVARGR
jgi:prepilin-type N-terminal cleavage/methylation domain-containing protein